MRQYQTADDVANDIRMTRAGYQGAFLVVEGVTDLRFYERFTHPDQCQVKVGTNKAIVLRVIDILDAARFRGVVAIVDADFMRLDGNGPSSPNVLLTDAHDLEMMLIASRALEKVMAEHGSVEKCARFTALHQKTVRETLLECGAALGYLRWLSVRESWSLKFEGIDFEKFVHCDTLAHDTTTMLRHVRDHSQVASPNLPTLTTRYAALRQTVGDPWQLCCGHDVIAILWVGQRKTWGTHNASSLPPEDLEKILRLAYEERFFVATDLYQELRAWEHANQPYTVLSV